MSRTKQKSAGSSLVELVVIVAVALGLALGIQAFLVKPYRIPSESMVPTLEINQRVLVNRIGNNFSDPSVGDVMVFHPPEGATGGGAQCGVAGPEDEMCPKPTRRQGRRQLHQARRRRARRPLRIVDGKVIRNGKPLDEPYAQECGGGERCTFRGSITIPPDH